MQTKISEEKHVFIIAYNIFSHFDVTEWVKEWINGDRVEGQG